MTDAQVWVQSMLDAIPQDLALDGGVNIDIPDGTGSVFWRSVRDILLQRLGEAEALVTTGRLWRDIPVERVVHEMIDGLVRTLRWYATPRVAETADLADILAEVYACGYLAALIQLDGTGIHKEVQA